MEININHEVEDTFYRYKMPKLSAKVEGKGNGIKTVIVNVTDIAKALYRKPIYVTKYFGCELGAQIHVDEKNERYIVNGAHEASRLQELLHGFIKKFVLCPSCGNPETTLHVKVKAGVVTTTCKACGNRGQLDPRHRLTQFIIKNPPVEESSAAEKTKGKKHKKAKNGTEANSEEDDKTPAGDDSQHSPAFSDHDDDDDWGEDTTEEAQQQRLNELSAMARSLTVNADMEKSEPERANIFFKFVTQLKRSGTVSARFADVKAEAERLNLGSRSILVVAEVLLSDAKTVLADIKDNKTVFVQFTRLGDHQQKAQSYLLGAVATLIEKFSDVLLPKSCHILKQLYDCDVVEEEVILAWFEKNGAKRYVSKTTAAKIAEICAPMLNWLREADTESEDEDEDEDDGPVEPAGIASKEPSASPPVKSQGTTNGVDGDESDDDIDIDAI